MQWLTLQETAQYLKISKETIYRLVTAKKMPYNRIGKVYRFNTKSLDEWVLSSGDVKCRKKLKKKLPMRN